MHSSYQKTLTTLANHEQVYQALTTGFEHWWTKPSQTIHKVGDVINFTFPPLKSFWTFQVSKLKVNKLVELKCTKANHIYPDKPDSIREEWLGTSLCWKIQAIDKNKTQIEFEHKGLQPKLLCFEACSSGWDYFFLNSLQAYLNTGVGTPHTPTQPKP